MVRSAQLTVLGGQVSRTVHLPNIWGIFTPISRGTVSGFLQGVPIDSRESLRAGVVAPRLLSLHAETWILKATEPGYSKPSAARPASPWPSFWPQCSSSG